MVAILGSMVRPKVEAKQIMVICDFLYFHTETELRIPKTELKPPKEQNTTNEYSKSLPRKRDYANESLTCVRL